MALNFSHRPIFPAHLSEDNLVSPIRIANGYFVEGIPEKSGDGFVKPCYSNREVEDCFDFGSNRADRGGSQEAVSKDILDLLPTDPFGMDISSTFTAITGWLEDLEVDYGGYGNDIRTNDADYELFAGLNFIWNKAMEFQALPGNMGFGNKFNLVGGFDACCKEKELGNVFRCGVSGSVPNVEGIFSLHAGNAAIPGQQPGECKESGGSCSDGGVGAPHTALTFALGYLGVKDLLSVERVCKSLHPTVRNDPLLWRSIHIDQPLSEKITDDALLHLTRRAQGNLQHLSLVECTRITDDGLKRVLDGNPRLTKLSVPGCTRLSIEGVVNSIKAFKVMGMPGIKQLRIGGLFGVTHRHFEELMLLLGMNDEVQRNVFKPHFYNRGNIYLSCDDNRAIDIEMCPRCQNLRLVYDCPAAGCQGKEHSMQVCRACTLCISRCALCGRCINDSEYVETFCLEFLCSDCWKQPLNCQERQDKKSSTVQVNHPARANL
ncbi:F-box protein SKIP14 [Malania oleifera]|uniref:F-box protein SKIP14 n=1 Tax=Malania oleifera TaxID=397392 RepID=UPI0025AEC353|nr:F-box protein SKIP14 [Malania oleifera]